MKTKFSLLLQHECLPNICSSIVSDTFLWKLLIKCQGAWLLLWKMNLSSLKCACWQLCAWTPVCQTAQHTSWVSSLMEMRLRTRDLSKTLVSFVPFIWKFWEDNKTMGLKQLTPPLHLFCPRWLADLDAAHPSNHILQSRWAECVSAEFTGEAQMWSVGCGTLRIKHFGAKFQSGP